LPWFAVVRLAYRAGRIELRLGCAASSVNDRRGWRVPERDGYIAGVPCWVDTTQPDPDAAASFYGGLFGWEFEEGLPPGSEGRYLIARLHGGDVAAVSLPPGGSPVQAAWNTYIWVDEADAAAARAREAGGSVLSEPFDVMDAGRMAVLADPEGAVFSVWQAKEHRGARVVNEPGSLNFNVLNVRDPAAVEGFYGAVFGWTTLDLGSGQFWAMAEYGDYLEALTPGLRERTASLGAAGFEDVVAAIARIPGDDRDAEPNWSVTFSTGDADATAARAEDLGGAVVVPPVDAPYSRMTVLRDPQGATFAATAFVALNKDVGR
jgi:predicted enzyme related to lactoylglutathione lyase